MDDELRIPPLTGEVLRPHPDEGRDATASVDQQCSLVSMQTVDDAVVGSLYLLLSVVMTLPGIAMRRWMGDYLGFSPAAVQFVYGVMMVPYLLKPLYGIVSDVYPIWGYRRRPYIAACSLLLCVAWAGPAITGLLDLSEQGGSYSYVSYGASSGAVQMTCIDCTLNQVVMVVSVLFSSFLQSFTGVVVDSWVVERVQKTERAPAQTGLLQTKTAMFRITGTLVAAFFSGDLLTYMSPPWVFAINACLPIGLFTLSLYLREPKYDVAAELAEELAASRHSLARAVPLERESLLAEEEGTPVPLVPSTPTGEVNHAEREVVERRSRFSVVWQVGKLKATLIWRAVRYRGLWKLALFLLVLTSAPSSFSAFFYFMTNELQFSDRLLGALNFVATGSSLLGAAVYGATFRKLGMRMVFGVTIVLAFLVRSLQLLLVTGWNQRLYIPDAVFAVGDTAVMAATAEIALLPMLILVAKVCPRGVEGTLYASMFSVTALGGIISDLFGTTLTSALGVTADNFDRLWLLITICDVLSLTPLLLLGFIPKRFATGAEVEGMQEEQVEGEGVTTIEEGVKSLTPDK